MNIDYNYNHYKGFNYKLITNNSTTTVNEDDHFNVLFKLFCYIILRYFI